MTEAPPPGTLRTYDAARPTLTDGPHRVRVVTSVEESTDGSSWHALDTGLAPSDSYVVVTGAEYRLAADAVLVVHPAANSTGDYGDTLPHVVLRDRSLPWQRTVESGVETGAPWLALLVVEPGEVTISRGAAAPDGQVYDTLTATEHGWRAALPRREDLSLLAHVREVNVDDRELAAGDDDGWVAVVTANRVPAAGLGYRACLVSLAGHQDLLDAAAAGAALPAATLPLLHDWAFSVGTGGTFHDVVAGVARRSAALGVAPAHPLILSRTDREGMAGRARYHGPLAGGGTDPVDDAPDLAAEAAFQLGRLLAAADRALSRELSEWHRQDLLRIAETARRTASRATTNGSGAEPRPVPTNESNAASGTAPAETTPEVALSRLTARRADPWGVPPVAGGPGPTRRSAAARRAAPQPRPGTDRVATLSILDRAAALSIRVRAISASSGAATPPPPTVTAALEGFALLRGLPLAYLVPNLALLPDESIRFFTLDHAWLDALTAGVLSVGGTGTTGAAFTARNAEAARAEMRAKLRRTAASLTARRSRTEHTGPTATASDVVTGLLLRSAAVSRWPQLEVRAFPAPAPAPDADPGGRPTLAPLRLERLTPSLLLGLFAGVPAAVWIEEHHHGLQLGFDRDPASGALTLPSRATGGSVVTVPVRNGQAGLVDVPGLATALAGQPGMPATVGSGALAAALIRPPFRQVFQ